MHPLGIFSLHPNAPTTTKHLHLDTTLGLVASAYILGYYDLYPDDEDILWTYSSRDEENYDKWRSLTVCVERVSSFSTQARCPIGYKQCFTGVCVQGSECGITEIEASETQKTSDGWHSNRIGDTNMYINYRRDENKLPAVTIGADLEHPQLCLSTREIATPIAYVPVSLPENNHDCKQYGVMPATAKIDEVDAIDFFSSHKWAEDFPGAAQLRGEDASR